MKANPFTPYPAVSTIADRVGTEITVICDSVDGATRMTLQASGEPFLIESLEDLGRLYEVLREVFRAARIYGSTHE